MLLPKAEPSALGHPLGSPRELIDRELMARFGQLLFAICQLLIFWLNADC
jgi:hypothetical protein